MIAFSTPAPENLIPIREAVRLFPRRRGGSKVSHTTLWRWHTRGSKGVRLATWLVGGQRYTTAQAVEDFIGARSAADGPTAQAPSPTRRSAEAMTELARMGL